MKYIALIYADERAWAELSADEQEAVYAQYRAFADAAGAKLVDGEKTAASSAATTVRVRDGQTHVVDGPFAESAPQLGGFLVFDVDSEDEAIELATRIPGLERGAVVTLHPEYVREET